ncbi:hypothetical protein BGZ46_004228, partial [Entomortierella lignicola]
FVVAWVDEFVVALVIEFVVAILPSTNVTLIHDLTDEVINPITIAEDDGISQLSIVSPAIQPIEKRPAENVATRSPEMNKRLKTNERARSPSVFSEAPSGKGVATETEATNKEDNEEEQEYEEEEDDDDDDENQADNEDEEEEEEEEKQPKRNTPPTSKVSTSQRTTRSKGKK